MGRASLVFFGKSAVKRLTTRLPLLGLVAGCFLGLLCAEFASRGGGAFWLLVLPGLLAVWLRAWKTAFFFGAWSLFWGVHAHQLLVQDRLFSSLERKGVGVVQVEGVVTRRLDSNGYLPAARMKIENGPWRGAKVGLIGIPDDLLPGDRATVVGDLDLPPKALNPGEMDARGWFHRIGLAGELKVERLGTRGPPDLRYALSRWAWVWREQVSARIVRGIPGESREALLIKALVLGDRSQGGEDLFGAFRKTGTMHVFAVSGLHVGLVALLGWLLVRALRLPRSWGLWIVIALIWAYAGVTGLRPPVVRAATMGSFVLFGFVLRREPSVGNALLASVPVVLVMDTYQWLLPGFQLSYTVVAIILLLSSMVLKLMRNWIDEDPFLPRALYTSRQNGLRFIREKFGTLFAVSGTAWIGSFPLMRWYFGVITPIAIPASMILVPMAFIILTLAFGGLLLGVFSPRVGSMVNQLNGGLVRTVERGVDSLSRLPGGQITVREHDWGQNGLLLFSLDDGGAAAHLDVGGGVLVDAGSARKFHQVIRPALRGGDFSPDSIVLTHPDGAHIGGVLPAIEEWPVKQVVLPTVWARSPAFRALLEYPAAPKLLKARSGMMLPLKEGVALEHVRTPTGREDRLADDRGSVIRLHWNGWKILFTGDAGFLTEKTLLRRNADVAAHVLIMGRHDSDFSGLSEFIQAVSPQIIVSSDSGFNQSERVPAAWKDQVQANGIDLWLLSNTGAVEIIPRAEQLELRAFLQEERQAVLRRN